MTVEIALRIKQQVEARAKEEAERKRNHELTMMFIHQRNAELRQREAEFYAKVREQGGCFKCSDFYRDKVRKHRKKCPKAA